MDLLFRSSLQHHSASVVDRKTASARQFQIESPQIPQEEDKQQKEEQRKGEKARF